MKIPMVTLPFSACVARPVSKKEISETEKAQAAMNAEWDKLANKKHPELDHVGCWDLSKVRSRRDVMAEARKSGTTVYFGTVFGICVEKGSELKPGDKQRKFKGRYDQNWDAAMFQELGSSLAAMEAGKSADFWGLIPGHICQQSDAEQAYTQALLRGIATWVSLPRERWPASWAGLHDPVVPLHIALYGHPDAGGVLAAPLRGARLVHRVQDYLRLAVLFLPRATCSIFGSLR